MKILLQIESKNKKYHLLHITMMRLPAFTSMSVTCPMAKKGCKVVQRPHTHTQQARMTNENRGKEMSHTSATLLDFCPVHWV